MKHLFIINPAAGKGKTLKIIPEIKRIFKEKREECTIEVTKYIGHATEIARNYSNSDDYRIYSIGGDGTLNEILNGMANSESSLAVIPGGSGNDFIKSIYNYSKAEPIENILLKTIEGKEKLIDLGKANNRYFLNIASVGFDAEVAYNSIKLKRFPFINGTMAYIIGILITIIKYKSYDLDIKIDTSSFKLNSLLVAVANGRYYGGGINVTPKARLEDGLFDVCLVRKAGRLRILRLFPKVVKGVHEAIEEVSFRNGNNIKITSNTDLAFNIDGEILKGKEVEFRIIKSGVKVVIPNYR